MSFELVILRFIIDNFAWLGVVAAIFGGIESVFLLSFLAGHGIAPFWQALIVSFSGCLIAEIIVFFIARSIIAERVRKLKFIRRAYKHATKAIENLTGKNIFIQLLTAKFAYGVGSSLVVKLSRTGIKFWKFIKYDMLALAISTTAISIIGWTAGKGISHFTDIYESMKISIIIIIVLVFGLHFGKIIFEHYLEKMRGKK